MSSATAFDFRAANNLGSENGFGKAGLKPLKQAIVFSNRKIVKSVVMKELRRAGFEDVFTSDHLRDIITELNAKPEALLVVDWEQGERTVVKALKAAQSPQKVDTRAIYFLAAEIKSRLVSVSSDYNVSKVHVGEITPKNIREEISEIIKSENQSEQCRRIFLKVAELKKQNDLKNAEQLLETLVSKEPDNLRAAIELADVYFDLKDYDRSLRIINQAIARDRNNFRAKHMLARILMKQGRLDEASELIERLNKEGILNIDRMIDLGDCFLLGERYEIAKQQYQKVLDIDEDATRATVGKSQCALMAGDINQAMRLIREITNRKELASIFNNSAILCIRKGQYKKGMKLYKASLIQVGKDDHILSKVVYNMGIGFLKWSKPGKAKKAFSRAIELDPDFSNAAHNLHVMSRKGFKVNSKDVGIIPPADLDVVEESLNSVASVSNSGPKAIEEDLTPASVSDVLDGVQSELNTESIEDEDFDLDDTYFESLLEST